MGVFAREEVITKGLQRSATGTMSTKEGRWKYGKVGVWEGIGGKAKEGKAVGVIVKMVISMLVRHASYEEPATSMVK
jgi:hypothetical protein